MIYALAFGPFVFLFLALLQPFGIASWQVEGKVLILASYGAITTVVMLVNFFLFPALFPAWFRDENWKVWKEMAWALWNIFSIGMVNLLYSHQIGITKLDWEHFWTYQALTLLVGVFPVTIITLLNYSYLLKNNLKNAHRLTGIIESDVSALKEKPGYLHLPAENGKDFVRVPLSGLLYIESADNYVEIFWLEGDEPRRELLRNTLKNLAAQLADDKRLFRCHRSYMVNLENVIKVSGNSQGYKLHLRETDQLIPVSRNLNNIIHDRISLLHSGS